MHYESIMSEIRQGAQGVVARVLVRAVGRVPARRRRAELVRGAEVAWDLGREIRRNM